MCEAPKAENIRVICRVRPLNPSEVERGSSFAVELINDKQIIVPGAPKPYTFDHVINPNNSQRDVFEIVARPIISDVMNGFNGTIFAYGQTASGKTHSMEGDLDNPEEHGLIPNIVFEIFKFIETLDEHFIIQMEVSFVELYKEKFQDLLNPSSVNLAVHEDVHKVPYLKGVTKISVCSAEEIFEQLERGKGNCAVSSTDMNAQSSRSHRVFSIEISTTNTKENQEMKGKLFLVDLAGSEKVSKTGAMGNTLEEAKMINKSLSTLGNVINALVEGHSHIPYRDSKLTRILQESLGGNAKTTMLICVSPASYNAQETKSTLMFGMRAKSIKNTVAQQIQLSAEEWQRRYEMERNKNERLQVMIEGLVDELERWRNGDSVSVEQRVSLDDIKLVCAAPKKDGMDVSMTKSSAAQVDYKPSRALSSLIGPGGPTPVLERSEAAAVNNEQLDELYNMLDMKDEEINTLSLTNDKIKKEMQEQVEMMMKFKMDNENMYAELTRLQGENEASKGEVKEVLQALEELAMSYDQKATELLEKHKDLENMQELLQRQRATENLKEGELQELKEDLHTSKKRQAEMMNHLLKELTEVGNALALTPPSYGGTEKLDEEFTVLRLHLKKMRSEAMSVRGRCDQLEVERSDERERIRGLENEMSELKAKNKELNSRLESGAEKLTGQEAARVALEIQMEALKMEITELHTKEDMMRQVMSERGLAAENAEGLKKKMDDMLETITKTHSAHLNEELSFMRKQLDEKSRGLEEIRETSLHLTYQNQQLTEERSRLQVQLDAQAQKLEHFERQHEKREQAKQDLRGLEETVVKELQTLHSLRKLFVQDLQTRIKKSTSVAPASADTNLNGGTGGDADEMGGSSLAQRQKIQFLEKNLDSLTSVHKQLVRDNADLRTELPKLEKRLKATVDRVKTLESSLKEAKDGAMRDRKRYQVEVDRIKDVVRQKNNQQNRVGGAKIQKKITGGGGGTLQRPTVS